MLELYKILGHSERSEEPERDTRLFASLRVTGETFPRVSIPPENVSVQDLKNEVPIRIASGRRDREVVSRDDILSTPPSRTNVPIRNVSRRHR
jgi:hypothetical protein